MTAPTPEQRAYVANLRVNDLALSEFLTATEDAPSLSSGRRSYILGALLGHVDPETFADILADAGRSVATRPRANVTSADCA